MLIEELKRLVEEGHIDINAPMGTLNRQRLLHISLQDDSTHFTQLLLEKGADPTLTDTFIGGDTPLELAVKQEKWKHAFVIEKHIHDKERTGSSLQTPRLLRLLSTTENNLREISNQHPIQYAIEHKHEWFAEYLCATTILPEIKRREHKVHYATCLFEQGVSLFNSSNDEASLICLEQSLTSYRELYRGNNRDIANALAALGATLNALGRYEEAHTHEEQALTMFCALYPGKNADVANALYCLGVKLYELGRYEEARTHKEQALIMCRAPYSEYNTKVAIATVHYFFGVMLHELGRYDEACTHKEEALAMRRVLYPENNREVANAFYSLGSTLHELGRYEEACTHKKEALAMRRALYPGNNREVANALSSLGIILHELGRFHEGMQYLASAQTMYKSLYTKNHQDLATTSINLGIIFHSQGNYDQAIQHYENANTIYTALQKPNQIKNFAEVARWKSLTLVAQDKLAEATTLSKQAVQWDRSPLSLGRLAQIYAYDAMQNTSTNATQEAAAYFKAAMALKNGPLIQLYYGGFLWQQNKHQKALEAWKWCLTFSDCDKTIFTRALSKGSVLSYFAQEIGALRVFRSSVAILAAASLAIAHQELGKPEEARTYLVQLLQSIARVEPFYTHHTVVGYVYQALKDYRLAAESFLEAYRLYPSAPPSYILAQRNAEKNLLAWMASHANAAALDNGEGAAICQIVLQLTALPEATLLNNLSISLQSGLWILTARSRNRVLESQLEESGYDTNILDAKKQTLAHLIAKHAPEAEVISALEFFAQRDMNLLQEDEEGHTVMSLLEQRSPTLAQFAREALAKYPEVLVPPQKLDKEKQKAEGNSVDKEAFYQLQQSILSMQAQIQGLSVKEETQDKESQKEKEKLQTRLEECLKQLCNPAFLPELRFMNERMETELKKHVTTEREKVAEEVLQSKTDLQNQLLIIEQRTAKQEQLRQMEEDAAKDSFKQDPHAIFKQTVSDLLLYFFKLVRSQAAGQADPPTLPNIANQVLGSAAGALNSEISNTIAATCSAASAAVSVAASSVAGPIAGSAAGAILQWTVNASYAQYANHQSLQSTYRITQLMTPAELEQDLKALCSDIAATLHDRYPDHIEFLSPKGAIQFATVVTGRVLEALGSMKAKDIIPGSGIQQCLLNGVMKPSGYGSKGKTTQTQEKADKKAQQGFVSKLANKAKDALTNHQGEWRAEGILLEAPVKLHDNATIYVCRERKLRDLDPKKRPATSGTDYNKYGPVRVVAQEELDYLLAKERGFLQYNKEQEVIDAYSKGLRATPDALSIMSRISGMGR